MMAKHLQIRNDLQPPFVIEYAGKSAAQEKEEGEEATVRGRSGRGNRRKPAAKKTGRVAHEPVTKTTPHELFDYVIEQGRKDYQVQRYKGLGEMTSTQLWETTMDPERRTLLSGKAGRSGRDGSDLYYS